MSKIIAKPSKRLRPSEGNRAVACPADKALADKLRAREAEREIIKRSTLGLYSLKTKESAFGVPFCAISDSLALTAAKQLLPQSDLYRVGSFCLYDGKCCSLSRPVRILDNKVS